MLSTWIGDQNQCYVLVSVLLNHAKAVSINEDLSRSDDNVKPFNTSTGWFSRFPKRYNFHNIKMTGAATFADTQAIHTNLQNIWIQNTGSLGTHLNNYVLLRR